MQENEYRILEYRLVGYLPDGTEMRYVECYGNSDWTKPTEGINGAKFCAGSLLIETDTWKPYFWDEVENDWVPSSEEEEDT